MESYTYCHDVIAPNARYIAQPTITFMSITIIVEHCTAIVLIQTGKVGPCVPGLTVMYIAPVIKC